MTTPLPPPPSLSSLATFETDCDAFFRALPTFAAELNAYQASISPVGRNMIINPAFQIDQRNLGASTAISDDTYCFDRWYALTQTASVAASQLTDPENGFTHAMRLTQSQASAQRFGFAQIIEGKNCKHARGNSGTLVPRIRCSQSTPIRYAILGWTGTEDVPTSDVVLNWTSGTFTAGNFFNSTTLSVLSVGAQTPSANTWTSLTALTIALGSSFTNIIVMVWTENTQAQNVTLDADYVQFEAGATATSFERRPIGQEYALCQRYFLNYVGVSADYRVNGYCISTTVACYAVPFPVRMQRTPAFSVIGSWNTLTAAGTNQALSNIVATNGSPDVGAINSTASGAGLVAGNGTILSAASSSASLQWSAEL